MFVALSHSGERQQLVEIFLCIIREELPPTGPLKRDGGTDDLAIIGV